MKTNFKMMSTYDSRFQEALLLLKDRGMFSQIKIFEKTQDIFDLTEEARNVIMKNFD